MRDNKAAREANNKPALGKTLTNEVSELGIALSTLFPPSSIVSGLELVALRFLLAGKSFGDFTVFQNYEKARLGKEVFETLAGRIYAKGR